MLFDLEEAGLVGSASFRTKHKNTSGRQTVINLDCVGDGDELVIFPTAKVRKSEQKLASLRSLTGKFGNKKITVHERGFAYCPSDQANFPYGAGIMAFRRGERIGLYCDKIHTPKDTVLEEENINILRTVLVNFLSGNAAE